MPDKDVTRDGIIEVAADLFWRQGYTSTGIAQILEAAGILRGSLYYHFPTKEDLLIATLEWRLKMLWPDVVQPVLDRLDDPIERVFGIMDGYRQLLTMFEFRLGCPIGNLALELDESHPRVRKLLSENFANWTSAIRKLLEDARGRFPPGTDLQQLADFCLTVMEGAVMLARTHRSIEAYDQAVTRLRDYFERLLADGADWAAPTHTV
jgi:AcrR family transcriptional regulator